jgi:arylsulfatase A-like enzyme
MAINRRNFLQSVSAGIGGAALASCTSLRGGVGAQRPNVIVVLTDDQGWGDLGAHGNEQINTPNLDRLHDESTRLTDFMVCPVCSPTRASLMTGRYNYRTGAIDTYIGRSLMHSDETTLPEMLRDGGYRTGIFGKWHLGDNYPLRAMDQGFEEALVHNGGGIGQPSDPPDNPYQDPILSRNGVQSRYKGYCTDIFTDAAIDFMDAHRDEPFFAYISTNAPHTPLEIGDEYVQPYLDKGLDEITAKIYGMVTNIDDNMGKLMAALEERNLADNTILLFFTDNGPQFWRSHTRYNGELRGSKGTVYQGGIKVPCFVRWPERLQAGREIDRLAAHIDLTPTLLDACGVAPREEIAFDGVSLMPLLTGTTAAADWPDRTLFTQWHRGDEPEPFRDCATRNQRYKLINGTELYDLANDPGETVNIAHMKADTVTRMRQAYSDWFDDVGSTRGYAPPRIHLGADEDNPTTLTRQDWRGTDGWNDDKLGYWEVYVAKNGTYDVVLTWNIRQVRPSVVQLSIGDTHVEHTLNRAQASHRFTGLKLPKGDSRLTTTLITEDGPVGARYVDVIRR